MYTHDLHINILKCTAAVTGSLKGGSLENVLPVNELETSPHLFQVATKHNRVFKFSYSLESQTGLWHFFISQV